MDQQLMFSIVEAPLHSRSSSSSSLQDPSTFSYLQSKHPWQKPHENYMVCNGGEDTEISIFDAQKYFSENSDPMKKQSMTMLSSTEGYGRNCRTRSFNATPTASSEASWNSRTGLLTNPPESAGISLRDLDDSKKMNSSVVKKWMFGRRNCCSGCSGQKSVKVKEVATIEHNHNVLYKSPSPLPHHHHRISASGFSFPILKNSIDLQLPLKAKGMITTTKTKPVPVMYPIMNLNLNPLQVEDRHRDSLEVFRPMQDDDAGSDESSDLFEIESFSTQTTPYLVSHRRDSSDEAPTFNARRFTNQFTEQQQHSVW